MHFVVTYMYRYMQKAYRLQLHRFQSMVQERLSLCYGAILRFEYDCVMQEAYRLQLRCFQSMVQEQQHLPSLKQLLKLYTAISLPKLASLMDMKETTLRSQLMLLKASA